MDGPWTGRGPSMASLPRWVGQTPQGDFNLWAPSVVRNSAGSYVMYFTANNRATDDRCVGVATSAQPGGPFDPAPEPLVCGGAGVQVIDATGFLGAEGQRFVVYKVKKPVDGGTLFEIRAHRTDSSGTVRIGPAKTLITMRDNNIEAPDVIASGGRVFLFVARGSFTDCSYRTEVWHAGALWTDTWQRAGTLMSTAATGLCGPGGAEVRRIGGDTWMVFHAWKCAAGVPDCRPGDPTERRRYRAMYTGLIGWGADGRTPHVLNHR
jgi:arabinan endo-1,5-alpha-L-arabinosidase